MCVKPFLVSGDFGRSGKLRLEILICHGEEVHCLSTIGPNSLIELILRTLMAYWFLQAEEVGEEKINRQGEGIMGTLFFS